MAIKADGPGDVEVGEQSELILLVDDDPEIRQLIGDFLAGHGFRVAEAGGGAEMDRAIAAERPALVVLDLMLPGEDGLAICRRLAASAKIPVIMLSALGEDTDRIVGLELGADDYLPKPCNPRELLARVRAVLRRREEPAPAASGPSAAGLGDAKAVADQEVADQLPDLGIVVDEQDQLPFVFNLARPAHRPRSLNPAGPSLALLTMIAPC